MKTKNNEEILGAQRKKFMILWHSYHAKNKITYSHDDAERMFNSIAYIFIGE